ncbi:MAG TPA: DUF1127 domain-containing protein [Xanthobacteraceae bacterium]|jgi:uncharacterized protein YjiS (DUF1127 family)|nr:DUF1127 domain-containing protein [Xanthobacteraceae bacterium]
MSTQTASSREVALRENVFRPTTITGSQQRWSRIINIVLEWRRRAVSRRELAALGALDLKDIGYPDTVAAEMAKPFWRA